MALRHLQIGMGGGKVLERLYRLLNTPIRYAQLELPTKAVLDRLAQIVAICLGYVMHVLHCAWWTAKPLLSGPQLQATLVAPY